MGGVDPIFGIISFDLASEVFEEIPHPPCQRLVSDRYNLSVLSGCLSAAIGSVQTGHFDVWVMKQYRVKESWVKQFSFDPYLLRGWPVNTPSSVSRLPRIICALKNGEILLQYNKSSLVSYDNRFKTLQISLSFLPPLRIFMREESLIISLYLCGVLTSILCENMIHQFVVFDLMVFQRQDIYLSVLLLPWLACYPGQQNMGCINAIDQTDIQAKEKQVQCIRRIFYCQLSVPLANLESKLIAYKAWEVEQGNILDAESDDVDGISSQVALAYKKALEMYNARAHLEEEIARQDSVESEKFQHFMSYLKFEQSSGDPARVQILYERAITEFPISSNLWFDYTRYLDKALKLAVL